MSAFPNSPRLLKGSIVLLDLEASAVQRIIALQYNPDLLTRALQVQGAGAESLDHLEALVNGATKWRPSSVMRAVVRNVNCL